MQPLQHMSRHSRPSVTPSIEPRAGPTTYEEVVSWAEEILTVYKQAGMNLFLWHLKRIVLTSKWSGCGGMDLSMQHIIAAIKRVYGVEIKYYLHSVCDNDEVCLRLLKHFRTKHMMSDLLHQYDSDVVKKIYNKQTLLMQPYDDFVRTMPSLKARKQKKYDLTVQLNTYIVMLAPQCQWPKQAPCIKHSQSVHHIAQCSVVP